MMTLEKERIDRLEALGIETDVFDTEEPYDMQREKDISEATLCILKNRPVPEDVEQRLLAFKKENG